MALSLTTDQRNLLRASNIRVRLLSTWYMDDGTYRFCEDINDITIGAETWLGASALASVSDIKSGNSGMAAEPVKIVVDGVRMSQAGFTDPAEFFRTILAVPLSNRLVDLDLAVGYHDSESYILKLPLFAGKINNAKITEPAVNLTDGKPAEPSLEILLDSLAMRYSWVTGRTRSHQDQLDIDPTDMFFSYTHDNIRNEQLLYWGKKGPLTNSATGVGGVGGGVYQARSGTRSGNAV